MLQYVILRGQKSVLLNLFKGHSIPELLPLVMTDRFSQPSLAMAVEIC